MTRPLAVIVAYSPLARQVCEWPVQLATGACVKDAVLASGLVAEFPSLDWAVAPVGIWGRKAGWEQPVRDGDRVEVYRPLLVDPKVARRERFRKQGSRATGLFAQRRPGAKPGY